jgi:hypothetical protein
MSTQKITQHVLIHGYVASAGVIDSWVNPINAYQCPWTYTASNYSSVSTIKFYASIYVAPFSGYTVIPYARLVKASDSSVVATLTGTEQGTNAQQFLISEDIKSSLVDGETYYFEWKYYSGFTASSTAFQLGGILIFQDGEITTTTDHVPLLFGYSVSQTTSESYVNFRAMVWYTFKASGGTDTCTFYSRMSVASGGTAYCQLRKSDGSEVATLTTTNTAQTTVSTSVSLTDGEEYYVVVKTSSSSLAAQIYWAGFKIVRSNSPTKTTINIPVAVYYAGNIDNIVWGGNKWPEYTITGTKTLGFCVGGYLTTATALHVHCNDDGTECAAVDVTGTGSADYWDTIDTEPAVGSVITITIDFDVAGFSLNNSYINVFLEWVNYTLIQEGFRFRNDDGSESAATWKDAQDANSQFEASGAFRLRMLIDSTGDPASEDYQLECRRKPSGGAFGPYRKIL